MAEAEREDADMTARRAAAHKTIRPEAAWIAGHVRRHRRALLLTTALQGTVALVLAFPARAQPATARPQGGVVVAGIAAIRQTATTTTIDQGTQRAAIDWSRFDVGRQQTVQFHQPDASSVTLNRVTNGVASQIAGHILANGQVVLVNGSGVVFTKDAVVDAQSLVVSSAGIANMAFMAGHMAFDQPGSADARIVNAGSITVKQAGLAALVAPVVVNAGVIAAKLGHVVLAGAATHTIDLYGDGLLSIDVTGAVKQVPHGPDGVAATALVTNTGVIVADGGTVLLTARAADGLVQTLVDAGGRVQANSLGSRAGTIVLAGIGGSLRVDGAVLAEGLTPGAVGGRVDASATGAVTVASGARLSVSGRAGGGTATLTAANTTVASGANITANANRSGHGGRVTVLSTASTNHAGSIAARGGPLGGDGGSVEVSGNRGYALTGTIDVGAPAGKAGNILIDPKDLTIVHGNAAAGDQNPARTAGAGTLGYGVANTTNNQVSDATINTFAGNVTLQATENLVVANGVTISLVAGPAQNLVLQAGNNLTVNSVAGAPTSITASGNIVLAASSAAVPGTGLGATNAGVLSVAGTLTSTQHGIFLSSDGSAATAGVTVSGTLSAANAINGVISVSGNTLVLASTASLTAGARVDFAFAAGGALAVGVTGNLAIDPAATVSAPTTRLGQAAHNADGITIADGAAASAIAFANNFVAPTLDLEATGTVSQAAATAVTAGTLTGHVGTLLLDRSNLVTNLGGFSGTSGVTLGNARPLDVTGAVTAGPSSTLALAVQGDLTIDTTASLGGGTLSLTTGAGGNIIGAGALTATTLGGTVAGNATFGNAANHVGKLAGFTTGGSFALADTGALTVTGAVQAAAGTSLSLTADGLSLNASGSLAFGGASAANRVQLSADAMALAPSAAGVNASSGTVALAPREITTDITVGTGTGLTLSAADFAKITAGRLDLGSLGGANAAARGIVLATALDAGVVSGAATLGLFATGAVSQAAALTNVGTLTGRAGSVTLGTAGNTVAKLGAFTTTNAFALVDSSPLEVTGAVLAGAAAPIAGTPSLLLQSAGLLQLDSTASLTGGAVTLNATAGGAIRADGPVTAFTLTGGSAGAATFANAGNAIQTLGAFTGGGGLSLTDAGTVNVGGVVQAGSGTTLALLADHLTVSGGSLGFTGASAANLVTLSADTVVLGGSAVNASPLGVVAIAPRTAGTAMTLDPADLAGTTAALLRLGSLDGATVAAGSLTIGVSFDASQVPNLALYATGAVSQTGGALANVASVAGAGRVFTLEQPLNDIGLLGPVTATGGDVSVASKTGLTVAGNVAGLNVRLVESGPRLTLGSATVAGNLAAGSGGLVSLTADALAQGVAGGSISAPSGTVELAPYTLNHTLQLGGTGSNFDLPGSLTASLLRLGEANGSVTAGNISFGAATTLAAGRLDLEASGDVSQVSGAALKICTLSGAARSLALNDPGNVVSFLTAFTTAAGLALADGQALAVSGALQAGPGTPLPGGPTLALATVGPLTLTGRLTAGTVSLTTSAGDVAAGGGAVTADTLTGSVFGAAALTGTANAFAKLGGFTAGNGLALVDNRALSVTGVVRAGSATPAAASPTLALTTAGALTLTAGASLTGGLVSLATGAGDVTGVGTIDAFALTGHVAGGASLGNAANAVGTLDAFTTGGDLSLVTTGALTIGGVVQAGVGKTLSLTSDSLTVAAGGALGLAGPSASDRISLVMDAISLSGTVDATTGSVAIAPRAATTLSIGGAGLSLGTADLANITAGTLVLGSVDGGATRVGTLDLKTPFALPGGGALALFADTITQEGAATDIGLLTGAAGTATLGTSGNGVAKLGAFTATTGFTLADAGALEVAGVVKAGSTLALSAAGDVTLDPGASLGATLVSLTTTAGGNVLGSGLVTAGTLSGSVAGSATLGSSTTPDMIGAVDAFTVGGALTLVSGTTLTVGTLTGTGTGTMTLQAAGDITLGGVVSAPGSHVVLMSPGNIGQVGGSLAAASLDGGGQAAARVMLDQAGNAIATLGAFTGTGGFSLADGTPLEITGPVATGPISGVAPNPTLALSVAGNLQIDTAASLGANTVSLTTGAGGNVSGVGSGHIAAAVLTGNVAGSLTLASPANAVAALQDVTTVGTLAFVDGGPLQVTGIVSASGVSLDATTLTLQATAKVAAPAVTLTAANGVIELGNPTLQTAELRVDAGVGSATLASTGNQLTGLGTSSATGDVTVVNAGAGLITVDGTVHAGAGQSIRLMTDQLAITGGLMAPGGTVAIAPYTPTRALTLDASRATGSLSLIQADLATIATGAGTIVLGSVDGGATRAASLAIDAPMIFANTLALQLFAQGGVTASGSGGVSVSHLGAVVGNGGLLLGTANAVDRIDALTATGPIVFGDTKDLTVAGPVTAGLLAAVTGPGSTARSGCPARGR